MMEKKKKTLFNLPETNRKEKKEFEKFTYFLVMMWDSN
jgi:hypothetical protein